MISIGQVRDRLAGMLAGLDLVVYSRAPQGSITLPAVVVGMPDWRPAADSRALDVWTLPLLVVVAQQAADPAATVDQLDEIWPEVAQTVQAEMWADQTLGGLVSDCQIDQATFGTVGIAGHDYPAYSITIKVFDI